MLSHASRRTVGRCCHNAGVGEEPRIDIFHTPLLTGREVARALSIPESTVDAWVRPGRAIPLVHSVEPERRGWPRVPFVGLVEAYTLRGLRDLGMTMADIRRAAAMVRSELGDDYALASHRISTDGVGVFVRAIDESFVSALDRQQAIPEVIAQHLRYIDWDDDGNPARLHLPQFPSAAAVVIDPDFGWGAPVLAESKTPVQSLVGLWRGGEPISAIAEEFTLPTDVVEDVLRQAA